MSAVGLLYVGAVLFVHGMMLLGHVSGAGFATHSWVVLGGSVLAVQWLMWSVLWGAFFVLMARGRADLAPAVGVLAIGNALLSTGLPGFLALTGAWHDSSALAGGLAALGILLLLVCRPVGRLLATHPRSLGAPPAPRQ